MMLSIRLALFAFTFVACTVPAFADGRKVNDRIVYEYAATQVIVRVSDGYPSRLGVPKFPRETATMTLTIAQVDPDGTAQGTLAIDSSDASKRGNVDITMTRGGAIVPKIDPALYGSSAATMNSRVPPQMDQASARANALIGDLEALDIAATGVSKRAALAVGDTWSVDLPSGLERSPPRRVRYSVTGQQTYAGRPTFVIVMTEDSETPFMTITSTATAYYDAGSRIVAGVHEEKHLIQPNHMEIQTTSDFTLK